MRLHRLPDGGHLEGVQEGAFDDAEQALPGAYLLGGGRTQDRVGGDLEPGRVGLGLAEVQLHDPGGGHHEHLDLVAAGRRPPPADLAAGGPDRPPVLVDHPRARFVEQERPAVVADPDLLREVEVPDGGVAAFAPAAPLAHERQQPEQGVVQVGPAAQVMRLLERVRLDQWCGQPRRLQRILSHGLPLTSLTNGPERS